MGDLGELMEALLLEAGEGIGRGLRVVCAAHEEVGTGVLGGLCEHREVLALKGVRASHDLEAAIADIHAEAAGDDGILRMELAVRLLVGLGDALDAVDDVHGLEQEGIDLRGVADDADDGLVLAFGDVGPESPVLDPGHEMGQLLLGGALLHDCYHGKKSRFHHSEYAGITPVNR